MSDSKEVIIDPKTIQKEYLKDLIRYRELFVFFSWRDILVRYRQAFLGIAWAIVRPVLTMAVFALIFGTVARFPSGDVSYPLFVLAGMIPWLLVSGSIVDSCNSILNNAHLITKVYFPRIIIPASQIAVHVADFAVNLAFLAFLVIVSSTTLTMKVFLLPVFVSLALLLCLGSGLWLSALTVQYRDFRVIVPFFMQFGMFLSPVGYATTIIPKPYLYFFIMNPVVGIIDGFRWAIFGVTHPMLFASISVSVTITLTLLVTGFYYFRNMERTFADKI